MCRVVGEILGNLLWSFFLSVFLFLFLFFSFFNTIKPEMFLVVIYRITL
jgi:hypothetical protein